jgi:hypothetical protein
LDQESLPLSPCPFRPSSSTGSFILGGEDDDILPLVYIGEETFHLAVFQAHSSTLCLLLERPPPSDKFYADFADSVGPALADLSADLTHAAMIKAGSGSSSGGSNSGAAAVGGGDLPRFLYFNASNMAVTRTVPVSGSVQDDKLVKLAAELMADLRRSGEGGGEVSAKLASEEWVVVQVAGARAVIVLLQEKSLNLMEVAEEVAKLKKSNFDNICML